MKWGRERAEAQALAERVTREVHAQFTFVEGYVAAHEKLVREIADVRDDANVAWHDHTEMNRELTLERTRTVNLVEALKEIASCDAGGPWGSDDRLSTIAKKALVKYQKELGNCE